MVRSYGGEAKDDLDAEDDIDFLSFFDIVADDTLVVRAGFVAKRRSERSCNAILSEGRVVILSILVSIDP